MKEKLLNWLGSHANSIQISMLIISVISGSIVYVTTLTTRISILESQIHSMQVYLQNHASVDSQQTQRIAWIEGRLKEQLDLVN